MARIIVQTDHGNTIQLDERDVSVAHINDQPSAILLLERMESAIHAANTLEQRHPRARPRRRTPYMALGGT